jgi:hypothetical protein
MNTMERNSTGMSSFLVSNCQKSALYDVYLNNKEVITTSSGFATNTKSNTFINLDRVLPDSNLIVSHPLVMDEDALKLQAALLKKPRNDRNSTADAIIFYIAVGLCFYVTASLLLWGSV